MAKKTRIIEPLDGSFENVSKSIVLKLDDKIYRGVLSLAGIEINCYVTPDNNRILASSRLRDVMKVSEESDKMSGSRWGRFLGYSWLNSLLDKDFNKAFLIPIEFMDGNQKIIGYRAELIPELCNIILRARREEKLKTERQKIIAEQCEILSSALAKVGIIALVDEATGFQRDRKYDALRILLSAYVSEGIQKWMKRFPDEFFIQLDRLYHNEKTTPRNRPKYYGKFINKYIYEPLEKGFIKAELDKKNIMDDGTRRARFHQWLTDFGVSQLTFQIGRALSVMEDSKDIRYFAKKMENKEGIKIQPELFDFIDD